MRKIYIFLQKHPVLSALIINMFFLLAAIVFGDMKYEVSDDFVMDTILSGAYGQKYDAHLLFSNMIIGYGLKLLYMIIPVVSWYFVMHIVLCFFSLTIVTSTILCRKSDAFGLFLAVLFVSFFSDDLYLLVQFTKTAAACIVAGGILLLYGFWYLAAKKKYLACIMGILLCWVGAMIRLACANMVLPFLLALFLSICIDKYMQLSCGGRKEKKVLIIRGLVCICLCGVTVLGAYRLWDVNGYLWKRYPEYYEYLQKNSQRASVTDVGGYNGDEVRDSISQMEGTTIEDYYTLISWNFVDQSVYTPERISNLSQVFRSNANQTNHSIKSIFYVLKDRHYERYTIVWGIALLLIITIILKRQRAWYLLFDLALTIGLLGYLVYNGRIIYRVEYGLFYCLGVLLIWQLLLGKLYLRDSRCRVATVLTVLLLVAKIPLYIPDTNYKTMTADEYNQYIFDTFYESWNFKLEKYRACVNKRPVYDELISQMENDTDHYYLCDFSSTIQLLYYHYKPWLRLPIGYYRDTYSYLGGVTTYYPTCHETWAANGLDYYNPYATIGNENILIVDNYYQLTKINYYKQYYDAGAEEEYVGKCGFFNIWKIRPSH